MPRSPRNIFTGGGNTQGAAATRNRGPMNNRGGGPGRGGGNKRGIPRAGLYHGKAGEAAANMAPDAFFRGALRGSGLTTGTGDPRDVFAQDALLNDLMGQYEFANQKNQKLSAEDWLKRAYGAKWGGKKDMDFRPGTMGTLGGDIEKRFQDYSSNQEPLTAAVNQMRNLGMFAPNSNPDYANFGQQVLAPQFEQEWRALNQAGDRRSMYDYMQSIDPARIQRLYAHRAPQYRAQSPARPMGGALSWWS